MRGNFILMAVCLSCCAVPAPSFAQWSSDPGVNLAIAVRTGEQNQPEVRPTSDGGCYIAWYDNDPSGAPPLGYDVRLQRLDRDGIAQLGPAGIRVADLGFDWTQRFGMDVDAQGNALLAFVDDRFPPDIQVTAARIDPSGNPVWGPTGIQVTSGAGDRFNPAIAGTDDGFIVVSWMEGFDLKLQRLDATGTPQWGPGVTVLAGMGETIWPSDLHDSDQGSAIVSWVNSTSATKHLFANKISSAGAWQWGAGIPLYTAGTLQFGNFPAFLTDGSGGAAFGWYSVWPLYQSYAQRVLSDGTVVFGVDGLVGSTDMTRMHVGPSVCFGATHAETFLFWSEEAGGVYGLYGQKFDAAGARSWGSEGIPVIPLESAPKSAIQCRLLGDGVVAAWQQDDGTGTTAIFVALLDRDGALVCPPFAASTAPSGKMNLASSLSSDGRLLLAWSDTRIDEGDIFAQSVNPDCSVGPDVPREVSPPGAAQPLVFAGKTTLMWEDKTLSGSETFNLYRGVLTELPSMLYGTCLAFGLTSGSGTDPELPAPGTGFFYHITGRNTAGEGPMGHAGDGTPRVPATYCP